MKIIFLLLVLVSCTSRQSSTRRIQLQGQNHVSEAAMKDYAYLLAFSNCHPVNAKVVVEGEEVVSGKYALSYSCVSDELAPSVDQFRAVKICADPAGEMNQQLCRDLVLESVSFARSSLDVR